VTTTTRKSKPARRSVSPFGFYDTVEDPYLSLKQAIRPFATNDNAETTSSALSQFFDIGNLPAALEKLSSAAANDAPLLDKVCNYGVTIRLEAEKHGVSDILFSSMTQLFEKKTESFLLDSDVVLFAKERDMVVGRFVAPFTESSPGRFSEFIQKWVETENTDRLLHFLDFCRGSQNPTFDHYLLFAHPALHRVVDNKALIKNLFKKTEPLLKKFESTNFVSDLRKTLSV
jgi:hypothetical protein